MLTAQVVAERYGVTIRFMILALDKIGCRRQTADSELSAATVARFESAFGEKIRAARPAPEPAFTAATDVDQPVARVTRQTKPHVMRVAHAKVTGKRDRSGMPCKALLDDPGLVHAIDAAGTWDGDPWRGEVVPGAVHFYGGPIGSGPYAACGTTQVRAVLGDEFVPDDEAVAKGQCPKCAEPVAAGKGFRNPPQERPDPFCHAFLRLKIDGRVVVEDCRRLGDCHRGPHTTFDGATWDIGLDDYVPATPIEPHRITEAS